MLKAYGDSAQYYYSSSAVTSLRDQEAWLERYYSMLERTRALIDIDEKTLEVAERVLDADNAYAVEEVMPAQETQEAQTA